jgi:hypothetical protein
MARELPDRKQRLERFALRETGNGKGQAMNFRWVVFITLWTFLAGPVFAPPPRAASRPRELAASSQKEVTPLQRSLR